MCVLGGGNNNLAAVINFLLSLFFFFFSWANFFFSPSGTFSAPVNFSFTGRYEYRYIHLYTYIQLGAYPKGQSITVHLLDSHVIYEAVS